MNSHTGVERDIQLPYEELEPCCQKEILNNRREKEFQERIREQDRSNVRLDAQKSVFKIPVPVLNSSCHCCQTSKDYDLLAALKQKIKNETLKNDEVLENDSDDEFLDEDDYISPAQQALLEKVAAESHRLRELAAVGLGVHLTESPDHILQILKHPQVSNLVLHIMDTNDCTSALIDFVLEGIAQRYPGTFFRRVPRTLLSNHKLHFIKDLPSRRLVCMRSGAIVDFSHDALCEYISYYQIDSIHDINSEIIDGAKTIIEKLLSHCNILSDTAEVLYRGGDGAITCPDDVEDAEQSESYCDVEGCGRHFPHKHVSSENDNSGKSSSLLLNEKDSGFQALHKSYNSSV